MTSDTTSSDRLVLDLAKRECRAMPLIVRRPRTSSEGNRDGPKQLGCRWRRDQPSATVKARRQPGRSPSFWGINVGEDRDVTSAFVKVLVTEFVERRQAWITVEQANDRTVAIVRVIRVHLFDRYEYFLISS
jgi:hypothetical protein